MSLITFLKNKKGNRKCNNCKVLYNSKYINCYRDCTICSKGEKDHPLFHKYVLNKY